MKYRKILGLSKNDLWYEDRKKCIGKWVTTDPEVGGRYGGTWTTIKGSKGYHHGTFIAEDRERITFHSVKLSKEVREL
jgi:hypothetical protein